uniref:Calcium-binding protein n=1 Tax=Aegilops tauschii subsp. strangulata TaxID=200361 RepID=A0A453TBS3_AEGTS
MEAAFDAYFRAADLDRDGRISGQEAVAFFKGSGLPQPVLAQIWTYADKNRTGFLGREDFFNSLKLVTVAQSGRQLTPDIVKSALFGPAAAKIPAPRINIPTAAPQTNSVASPPQPTQALGPRQHTPVVNGSQGPPGSSLNPQVPQPGNLVRPPQPPNANIPPAQGIAPRPPVGGGLSGLNQAGSTTANLSTDWFSGKKSASPLGGTSQAPVRGASPQVNLGTVGIPTQSSTPAAQTPAITTSVKPNPTDLNILSSQPAVNDSKALVPLGNGSPSNSSFGVDPFSATPQPTQNSSFPHVSNGLPGSTAHGPAAGPHHPPKPMPPGPVQGISSLPSHTGQVPPNQPAPKQNQFNSIPSTPGPPSANIPGGQIPTNQKQFQAPWPKITQADVRKYMIVFIKVDRDRDGKITGEEARNLFLSWRLPREILRKVWDLSDQDKDGMLSFKEFCFAVYLMERFREQRPLPDVLPDGIWAEGISLPSTGQFAENPSGPAPHQSAGFASRAMQGPHPGMPPSSVKQQHRRPLHFDDDTTPTEPQKPKVPALEKHLVGQLSKEEQNALEAKFKEASDADKKVQELEKEILDSREKTDYYRTKMQELILYKSRCDNRFNEVSESMSADKREVQSLSAKYDERCKKVGDVASKLSMDEATFREIQAKKLEIYNSIVKLQKGDGDDEKLQERANQIQSELEELVKSLNEQCKRYGLRAKPTTLVELPFGWQPGIQETAAVWDEEWDRFAEDGFSIIKELTVEVEPPAVKESHPTVEDGKVSSNGVSTATSTEKEDSKTDKTAAAEQTVEPEATGSNGKAELAKNPPVSPAKKAKDGHTNEPSVTNADSPRAADSISNDGASDSPVRGDKTNNRHSWGPSFDHGDDNDSLWNFGDKDGENGDSDLFFGPGGLPPIRTGGSTSASAFGKEQKPMFDSVPGTPLQKSVFDYSVPSTPMQNSSFDYSVPSTPMQKSLFDSSVPSTPMQRSLFDSSVPSTPMQKSLFDSSVPSTPMGNSFYDSFPSTPMQGSLFDSGPGRVESPTAGSTYGGGQQKGFFDSSVPSTPMYNSSFSPRYSEAGDDSSFDTFSQMDSFGAKDSTSFGQPRDSFSRFDSFGSSAELGGSNDAFGRFDSFRSNADQGGGSSFTRYDSMSSNADHDRSNAFARFDSMKSTDSHDQGYSFDDDDPFGTGPFKPSKPSTEASSPTRHGTDKWSAF